MKRFIGFVALVLGGVIAFASCAPVALLNTITPSSGYSLDKNITYGDLERHKLDVYHANEPRENAPVIIFIHGGSWDSGNKNAYKFIGEAFASKGFTVAIPNYRLYPEVIYPEFINDTALATAFIARRFPDTPVVLVGHSAGAYNAMMVTADPQYLGAQGLDVCKTIAATIGLAGPYGAFPLSKEPYITIFPGRQAGNDSPVQIKLGPTPPIFAPIGDKDETVSDQHSRELVANVTARGGTAKFKLYPGLSHTDVAKVMSRYFDGGSELKGDVIDFITKQPTNSENYCR